ncbi:MAG: DUF2975 domain-containing protein [Paludibacter sp.]|nr:DUF2975 domain-containing protein [Paludibacter sp.]
MKRLQILCIILLIVFFGSLYQGAIMPFVEGVKYGLTIAEYENSSQVKTEDFLMMDVVPKNSDYLDKSEINLKTNEPVMMLPTNISVLIHSLPEKPVWMIVLQSLYTLILLGLLVLGIWIPFLVVKILRSLQHSVVFDRFNLKRINRIAIFLLVMGIAGSLVQAINVFIAQHLIDLANYEFSYAKVIDFNAIIMGIVILVMNEVLRIAIEIKEEQDLTI